MRRGGNGGTFQGTRWRDELGAERVDLGLRLLARRVLVDLARERGVLLLLLPHLALFLKLPTPGPRCQCAPSCVVWRTTCCTLRCTSDARRDARCDARCNAPCGERCGAPCNALTHLPRQALDVSLRAAHVALDHLRWHMAHMQRTHLQCTCHPRSPGEGGSGVSACVRPGLGSTILPREYISQRARYCTVRGRARAWGGSLTWRIWS